MTSHFLTSNKKSLSHIFQRTRSFLKATFHTCLHLKVMFTVPKYYYTCLEAELEEGELQRKYFVNLDVLGPSLSRTSKYT